MGSDTDQFVHQAWDYVITVCDNANESCPVFPASTHRLHWSFADPSQARGSENGRLRTFCQIRDAISQKMQAWVDQL